MTEVANGSRCGQAVGETIELVPDLKAEDVDLRLRHADRRTEIGHRELAFYLAEMQDRGLHQMLGFSSALEYACRRLEMGRRHAQDLIAVGRALNELRQVDEAFCAGKIRWSRVRLLVRIAVPETERAWLERALTLKWNEFDREVATSERGRPPRADRRGLPQVKILIRGRVNRVDYETWEIAKKKLEDERGERMTDAECMAYAAHVIVGTKRGASEAREPVVDSVYRVVMQKCPECELAAIRTAEGLEEVDKVTAACIDCDAPSHTPETDPDHEDKTPRPLRTKVLIRDGLACRACHSRQQLMAHHIVWLSRHGKTKASNLITLCFRCHGLVHEDLLIVSGKAPNAVRFTDRHGAALDAAAPLVGAKIARIRMESGRSERLVLATGAVAAPAAGEAVEPLMTFDRIPDEVSCDWWTRHRHLFAWVGSRGEMEFQDGVAAPPRPPPHPEVFEEAERSANDARAGRPAAPDHRPQRFSDVIGQERAVAALRAAAVVARKLDEPVDHVLLLGEPGLGKTTLARALANEVGKGVRIVAGSVVEDPSVLLRLLTSIADRDVVFVDEIHALPKRVIEALYEAMEDRRISVTVKHGSVSRTLGILLPRFTLVGATSEIGRLPEAGVSRFPIREHLVEYGQDDLAAIVTRAAVRGGVAIDAEAAQKVASVSRGTARHAIGLVRRLRNGVLADDRDRIDVRAVETGLEAAGIDSDGLNAIERRALEVLRGYGRPMGVSRWAAASKMPVSTLRILCEPELVRLGLVCVTSRGRMASGGVRAQLRAVEAVRKSWPPPRGRSATHVFPLPGGGPAVQSATPSDSLTSSTARDARSYADLGGADLTGFVCRDGRRSATG